LRFGKVFGAIAFGVMLALGHAGTGQAADAIAPQAGFPPAPPPYKGKLRHKTVHYRTVRHKKLSHYRREAEYKTVHAGRTHHKAAHHRVARRGYYHRRGETYKVYRQERRGRIISRELRAPQAVAAYRDRGQSELAGQWQIISINSKPAIMGMRGVLPDVSFSGSRVTGQSGCNNFSGAVVSAGAQMQFTPAAATQMLCPRPLMKQEQGVYKALGETKNYRFVPRLYDQFPGQKIGGGVRAVRELQLLNDKGQVAAVLVRK